MRRYCVRPGGGIYIFDRDPRSTPHEIDKTIFQYCPSQTANMAPSSNWIALLLTTLLVQYFSVHALPNPESFLDQGSPGAAAVPRVLLPRGQTAIDGLTSTDLVKREPAKPPASHGVAGKHSKGRSFQTHITAIEAARGGTVIASGSEQLGPAKSVGKGLGESKIGM